MTTLPPSATPPVTAAGPSDAAAGTDPKPSPDAVRDAWLAQAIAFAAAAAIVVPVSGWPSRAASASAGASLLNDRGAGAMDMVGGCR